MCHCAAGLSAVASCPDLRVLTVGSFNLVHPLPGRQDLKRLEHLSFGGGFANKGLHLLFPLLDLRSLHITVGVRECFVWVWWAYGEAGADQELV